MTEETKPYKVTVQDTTPAMLLKLAIDQNAPLDKLEKLMDLQVKWEAYQAQKAYTAAMANFKKNPPEIEKDSHVEYRTEKGIMKYNHASLGNVTTKINSALSEHGLSAAWTTTQDDKSVTVTCKITHIMGHSEQTSLTAGLDISGGKNTIQALGSTISYLERYTILALTGLATHDQDDDGQKAVDIQYITEQQKSVILDFINEKKVNMAKFLAYMKVNNIEVIPTTDYNKAISSLKAAKGEKA